MNDWSGYLIHVPQQHKIIITGLWKKEKDVWFWKCCDCTQSSGTIHTDELIFLYNKGRLIEPEMHQEKIPSQYSNHPDENGVRYSDIYEMYGGYWE